MAGGFAVRTWVRCCCGIEGRCRPAAGGVWRIGSGGLGSGVRATITSPCSVALLAGSGRLWTGAERSVSGIGHLMSISYAVGVINGGGGVTPGAVRALEV